MLNSPFYNCHNVVPNECIIRFGFLVGIKFEKGQLSFRNNVGIEEEVSRVNGEQIRVLEGNRDCRLLNNED